MITEQATIALSVTLTVAFMLAALGPWGRIQKWWRTRHRPQPRVRLWDKDWNQLWDSDRAASTGQVAPFSIAESQTRAIQSSRSSTSWNRLASRFFRGRRTPCAGGTERMAYVNQVESIRAEDTEQK